MFMRKNTIIEPTSVPFINYPGAVCIQDDQFLPDYSQETSLQYYDQEQPRLQSPFQYHPGYQFVSPPSSAPSSPTSSPASSISHFPVTTTAVATEYPSTVFDGSCLEAPSMTPASSYNPSISIQHSASPAQSQSYIPQYQQQQQQYLVDNTQMLTHQSVANNHGWDSNLQLLSPARIQNNLSRTPQYSQDSHLNTPSTSSGRSSGSSYHHRSNKPLPTPVQTPIQNSFLASQYQTYDPSSHDGQSEVDMGMRRVTSEQQQKQHQHQPSDYSLAASVSSVSHNSPVTPQTGFEDLDEASRAIINGEKRFPDVDHWMNDYLRFDAIPEYGNANGNSMPMAVPKLNRTISDVYQDELYTPAIMQTPQVSKQATNQQNLLTPSFRNVIADRLQAANQGHLSARSQSPAGAMNRDRSPFRQNSPLAAEFDNTALQPQATSVPSSQTGVNLRQTQTEPKTMSPKDAVLDFNEGEDSGLQLFPPNQTDFNLGDALGQNSSFQQSQGFAPMESFPAQFNHTAATSQPYTFAQPQGQTFPTSIPHFDSGCDVLPSTEMGSPQAQPKTGMHPIHEEIARPLDTSSDSGTYTCTYHGCTLRFETPAKLQKHKREAHRQTTPGGHLVGRDSSARNSQAGPHKCERINPSTGKPCNSIFSRPYDLTRHEDTIHNARKQKVRCHLCTEEKTFSRNDALTRHMRVVHPEIDWPGKQRRRGRE